jgi:diguanylate cyclase (GGDEF)-like protein/PAS domain S-box-containing protein
MDKAIGNSGEMIGAESAIAGEARELSTPGLPSAWRLLISILAVIFTIEFLVMWLLVIFFSVPPNTAEFLADSALLASLSAPFLWMLVVQPLRMAALREKKRVEAVMGHVMEGVVGYNAEGEILSFNPAAEKIFGYSAAKLLGRKINTLFSESEAGLDFLPAEQETSDLVIRNLAARRRDGSLYYLDLSVSKINSGAPASYIGIMRDISERKRSEKELGLATKIFENIGEATVVTDAENKIVSVNPAFTEITGYAAKEAIGKNPRIMGSGRHDKEFFRSMWAAILDTGHWQGEIWDRRKNGDIYPKWLSISVVRDKPGGQIRNYIAIFSDITERKEAEKRIQFMAHYDALTGLPNRVMLHDRLSHDISHAARNHKHVALLFLDLDRFKIINDSLGHNIGDLLLQSVGERLKECLRSGDTVARLGGDEFVVILPGLQDTDYAATVARKILECLATPHAVGGHELNTTASIGISVYPHDGSDRETLIKNADVAMYKSKEAGRNNYLFFTEEMNARAEERLSMENSLRHALEREEFVLYFQPQMNSATGRIIGAEALIRWRHPSLGLVMPGTFIPIAEESGLIVAIGEWVLREACRQNRAWQMAGLPAVSVAVNLSAMQFRQKNLVEIVADTLRQTGLAPRYLELEITESSIIQNVETAINTMHELKAMGVLISIDDFGTGYSNLGYLKRFPIDKLKVDQSFVRDLTTSPDDATIVRLVINMAKSLQLKVIAEGVETREQLDFLSEHQCEEVQGYYFSRPVPEEEFKIMLESAPAHSEQFAPQSQRSLPRAQKAPEPMDLIPELLEVN